MRIESSVTSVSWIPSEVVSGLPKAAFAAGALHYDAPPPDVLGDVAELYAGEKFRFANRLSAWIEVVDGRVVDVGYSGRGYMCGTRVRLGRSWRSRRPPWNGSSRAASCMGRRSPRSAGCP